MAFILGIDFLALLTFKLSLGFSVFFFLSLVVLFNVFSLKIEVEGPVLYYVYGFGFVSYAVPASSILDFDIKDINSLQPWLYNPSGTQSLIIKLKSGRSIPLPTKDPKKIINYFLNKI